MNPVAAFIKRHLITASMLLLVGCLKPDSPSDGESLAYLTITGKVTRSDGADAPNTRIFLENDPDSRLLTNEIGEFSLRLNAPDLAFVSSVDGVAKPSFNLFFEASDGTNLQALSSPVSTGSRGSLAIDPIVLRTPASVEGKILVLRDDGQITPPSEGVSLRIGRNEVSANSDGTFKSIGLPAGKIPVHGHMAGSAPLFDSWTLLPGEAKKMDLPLLLFPETGIHGLFQQDNSPAAVASTQGKTPYTKSYIVRHSPGAMYFRYHHKREELETPGKIEWQSIQQNLEYDFGANGGHTLYYQFADLGKQALSQMYALQSIIDPLGTSTGFIINDGSGITTTLDLTLKIDVPPTAFRMKVAESIEGLKLVEWELPKPIYNYRLKAIPNIDIGSRTLYVQFGDVTGFLSPVYSETIVVNLWPLPIPPVFVINGGAPQSKSRLVKLDIQVPTNAYEMQVFEASESSGGNPFEALGIGGGNGGSTNTKNLWLAVKPEMFFKFSGPGMKTLYLQFRTIDQITSPLYDQQIRIDPFPVSADGFLINSGAPTSRSRHLEVTLIPPYGSVQFKISENGQSLNQNPWLTIVPSYVYSTGSEGLKTLYVSYRNIDGDESPVFTETIYVEAFPPETGDFVINGGQPVTISPKLHIDLYPPINARHFMIREGLPPNDEFDQWQEIRPDFALLVSGTGSKLVFVRYRSDDGIISAAIQRTIFYDPFPFGSAGVDINNGATTTTSSLVNLHVYGEINLITMRISHDINHINILPFIQFQDYLTHQLPDTNGLHKVYVQFKTASGELSPIYFSEITRTGAPAPGP